MNIRVDTRIEVIKRMGLLTVSATADEFGVNFKKFKGLIDRGLIPPPQTTIGDVPIVYYLPAEREIIKTWLRDNPKGKDQSTLNPVDGQPLRYSLQQTADRAGITKATLKGLIRDCLVMAPTPIPGNRKSKYFSAAQVEEIFQTVKTLPRTYCRKQIANMAGISGTTFDHHRKFGRLPEPSIKVGNRLPQYSEAEKDIILKFFDDRKESIWRFQGNKVGVDRTKEKLKKS